MVLCSQHIWGRKLSVHLSLMFKEASSSCCFHILTWKTFSGAPITRSHLRDFLYLGILSLFHFFLFPLCPAFLEPWTHVECRICRVKALPHSCQQILQAPSVVLVFFLRPKKLVPAFLLWCSRLSIWCFLYSSTGSISIAVG